MKGSRKFVIGGLLLVALFCGGAILGSYLPAITTYLTITVTAIAAAILILYGYTGHRVKKKVVTTTTQPKTRKSKPAPDTTIEETGEEDFEDVFSGR